MNTNNKRVYIDIGSSTVKVYESQNGNIAPHFSQSIPFKDGFTEEKGITDENKESLYRLIESVKEGHPDTPVKLYATAVFRKMSKGAQKYLRDGFYERTGFLFNVIDQDLENFYLQTALIGNCQLDENLLLVNIGGGSTELSVVYRQNVVEKHNLDFGVDTINTVFPNINSENSEVSLAEVVSFVDQKLPNLQNDVSIAFYNGGELRYMKLASYKLKPNHLFSDGEHPSLIELPDLKERNEEVFSKVRLAQLEALMPENPKWMHGARGCSAIAQAIFERYGAKKIIPSDSNLINGACRQEFRYITLSGSFRKHPSYILNVKDQLEKMGTVVLSPRFTKPNNPGEEFVVFTGEEGKSPLELERHHLDSIEKSDALVVCDPEGYVGASALIEIGYANSLGKCIIFAEKPQEFMLNTLPCEIGI